MKSDRQCYRRYQPAVTSLVEVWIEIFSYPDNAGVLSVTSLVEVWIEIPCSADASNVNAVTSLVEVWIEI